MGILGYLLDISIQTDKYIADELLSNTGDTSTVSAQSESESDTKAEQPETQAGTPPIESHGKAASRANVAENTPSDMTDETPDETADTKPDSEVKILSPTDTEHVPRQYLKRLDTARDLVADEAYVLPSHFTPRTISDSIDDWRNAVADLELLIVRVEASESLSPDELETYPSDEDHYAIFSRTEDDTTTDTDAMATQALSARGVVEDRLKTVIATDQNHAIVETLADDPSLASPWLEIWATWESLQKAHTFERETVPVGRISGIGEKRATVLADEGYETLYDVRCATIEELEAVDGIGSKRAASIRSSAASRPISDIHTVGATMEDKLVHAGIRSATELTAASQSDLTSIEGIGEKRAQQLHARAAAWLPVKFRPPDGLFEAYAPPYESTTEAWNQLTELERSYQLYTNKIADSVAQLTSLEDDLPGTVEFERAFFDHYQPPYDETDDIDSMVAELDRWNDACERLVTVLTDIDAFEFPLTLYETFNIEPLPEPSFTVSTLSADDSATHFREQVVSLETTVHRQQRLKDHLARADALLTRLDGHPEEHATELRAGILHQVQACRSHVEDDTFSEHSERLDQYLTACDEALTQSASHTEVAYDDLLLGLGDWGQNEQAPLDTVADMLAILEISGEALALLQQLEYDHPTVAPETWTESIQLALTEQYPQAVRPIESQLDRLSDGIWELDDLHSYDWDAFEVLIGNLYRDEGFDVRVTQATGDLGVDIWATKAEQRVAVQVKQNRTGQSVGREPLQKIVSTLAKGDADQAVVVTSSHFADTATRYAHDFGPELTLVNADALIKRLSESTIPPSQ